METLAQKLRNEGKAKWMKEGKVETAKRMLNDGVSIGWAESFLLIRGCRAAANLSRG